VVESLRKTMYDYENPKAGPSIKVSDKGPVVDVRAQKIEKLKETRIDRMNIPVRLANALHTAAYSTLYDVACRTQADLLRLKGMGRESLREIESILDEDLGVTLTATSYKHKPTSIPVAKVNEVPAPVAPIPGFLRTKPEPVKLSGLPIHHLDVPLWVIEFFVRAGVKTVEQVAALSRDELVLNGFNESHIDGLVVPALTKVGMHLKLPPPPKNSVPPVAPPAPPKPCPPSIKLTTTHGVRLNDGDNVAPHLVIDGKTMHVFTLVPGGVYLSYVKADLQENR
jgi:hypothetical protein